MHTKATQLQRGGSRGKARDSATSWYFCYAALPFARDLARCLHVAHACRFAPLRVRRCDCCSLEAALRVASAVCRRGSVRVACLWRGGAIAEHAGRACHQHR